MRVSKKKGKTSLGMQENTEALLAYLIFWVTGIIFYLLERKSKFVRFHALQSLILFLLLQIFTTLFSLIPIFGLFLVSVIGLATVVLWIICMIEAYQGRWFELPVIGKIAKKKVK